MRSANDDCLPPVARIGRNKPVPMTAADSDSASPGVAKPCSGQQSRRDAPPTLDGAALRAAELETALRELTARYVGLLEGLNDIVFTLDAQGQVREVSGNTMGILGLTAASLASYTTQQYVDMLHPGDRATATRQMARWQEGSSDDAMLVRMRDAAGEYRWLEVTVAALRADDATASSGLRGTARDVTDSVRSSRAMESLNRAAASIQAPGLAPRDVLDAVTRHLGELGFCSAVWLAAQAGDVAAAEYRCDSTACPIQEALIAYRSGPIPPAAVLRIQPERGTDAHAGIPGISSHTRNVIAAPMQTQDVLLGVLLVAGSQVAAEYVPAVAAFANQAAIAYRNAELLESLRTSEAQYHTLFESVTDGLTVFDGDGTISEVNTAACRIYGYTRDELIGMSLSRLVHPDRYHGLVNLRAAIARDGYYHVRSVNVRKDASQVDVEIHASAFEFQGQQRYLTVDTDVTDRVQSERALVRSEKLRALGQMAGGVAHDFNNLLGAIRGFCSLALLELDTERDSARADLERALASTVDASEAVRRLQSLYRHAEDTSDLMPLRVDVLAAEAVALTQPRWKDEQQRRGCTVHVITETGAARPVLGNASELRRVLANLLMNAIDAMPDGGTLTVTTAQEGDWTTVSVRDTGVGMSEAQRSQVFEPFYTTKGTAGSGLGLTMSLGIVERHGGRIAVRSALGQGSTFTVYLPACAPDLLPMQEADVPTGRLTVPARLEILAVDDEPAVLTILARLLVRDGHHVTTAQRGADALALLRERRFDLVITDLGMPDVSGHKVARLARVLYPQMPVVLATGWGETISPEQLASIGATHLLSKPYAYDELVRAVEAAIAPQ